MPFTIVQSPAFSQRGIALNESSCSEQVNGLVEVQTRFTIAKSRQQEIDRLFYVDAPPPIDPACIAKSSLLTNRLYMQSRTVSSSTGFLTIDARYVGGLARAGFVGYFLTEQKGPAPTSSAGSAILGSNTLTGIAASPSIAASSGIGAFTSSMFGTNNRSGILSFNAPRSYIRQNLVEFVQIGTETAVKVPVLSSIVEEDPTIFLTPTVKVVRLVYSM